MRKALFAILLAASLMPPAGAQTGATPTLALQDFVGDYVLSNGRVLTVSRQRQVLKAQLDGQAAVALKSVGAASFTGTSGDLRIDFDQRANGNVAALTVSGGGAALPSPPRR